MLNMQYSPAGFTLTKGYEGLRLTAYQDVARIWTNGYGHVGPDVHPGQRIDQAQADAWLHQDLQTAVDCVNRMVTRPISQAKFDSLVDFTFNAGQGSFIHSTLLKMVNAGTFSQAAAQFGLWVHAGGRTVAGLVRRRKDEANEFAGNIAA